MTAGSQSQIDDGESAARRGEVASLVMAARAGSERAFAELYHRFARFAHSILLAHAPENDVEDMLQDVFARAYAKLATLRDPSAFGSWLAEIARNRARQQTRARIRLVPLRDDIPSSSDPDAALESERVLAALRSLPDAYREPLILRLVEGMGGVEIAEHLGMTHGSVRVNLYRGMSLLRERLGIER